MDNYKVTEHYCDCETECDCENPITITDQSTEQQVHCEPCLSMDESKKVMVCTDQYGTFDVFARNSSISWASDKVIFEIHQKRHNGIIAGEYKA